MNDWTLLPTSSENPGRGTLPFPSPKMRSQVFISRFHLPVGTLLSPPAPGSPLRRTWKPEKNFFYLEAFLHPASTGPRFSTEVITSHRMPHSLSKCTCRIPARHSDVASENVDTGLTQNHSEQAASSEPLLELDHWEREQLLWLVSSSVFPSLCLHYTWHWVRMGRKLVLH